MKKIIRKTNNVNVMLVSKKTRVYYIFSFLIIFLIISYLILLFFNIHYIYAIKDKKVDIVRYGNITTQLQSKYLSKISDIENNIDPEKYIQLNKIVFLQSNLNTIALSKEF